MTDRSQTLREYSAKRAYLEIWKMQTSQQWLPEEERESERESGRLHTGRNLLSMGVHVLHLD